MADSKITDLSDGGLFQTTDNFVVARSGANNKISGTNVLARSPGFEIGYDEITSPVSITGTTEASPTTIITCSAHTFDGSAVMVEFFTSQMSFPTGNLSNTLGVSIWEGATELTILAFMRTAQISNQFYEAVAGKWRFTPSAASHTYLIRAWVSATTGTPQVVAGSGGVNGNSPAFCRFTKV